MKIENDNINIPDFEKSIQEHFVRDVAIKGIDRLIKQIDYELMLCDHLQKAFKLLEKTKNSDITKFWSSDVD